MVPPGVFGHLSPALPKRQGARGRGASVHAMLAGAHGAA
jgi:hypothetical protein